MILRESLENMITKKLKFFHLFVRNQVHFMETFGILLEKFHFEEFIK